jgi:hypothetical protein
MRSLILPLLLFTLFLPNQTSAQATKKEQIAKALDDYFHLERENIHVHFDKKVFLTSEKVWFKGYVFHRKMNMPFFATTNIYASLIDSDGNLIETQLLYGSLASFSGSFDLKNTKSGKYYLQFYTNWMNNFTEDESAVYEVDVINPEQGITSNLALPDLSKINISFHPEGGTFVKDCSNSIGISITDCNGNPVQGANASILNSNGETLKTIQLNKFGFGRFDLVANTTTGLKAEVTVNNVKYQQALPQPQLTGVTMEINNYAVPDKLIAKLKTNKITADSFGNQPLHMVIQQDEKALIYEFNFAKGKLEQAIAIPQNEIFDGLNTIRIIDPNLKQIAERIIFKYPKEGLTAEIKPAVKTAESTEIKGKIDYPTMNVSISVLPEGTAGMAENNDMYGSFLIAPYIENSKGLSGKYYLTGYTRSKHHELDLFLVNQTSKYKWRDIMQNPPKNTHTFDMGVSLKATLNNKLKNKKDYKVRVVSISGMIDEQVDINEKGEIQLDNLILADSSRIQFSLLEKGVKKQELKLYPQIFNNVRKFNKAFKPIPAECLINNGNDSLFADYDLPKLPADVIELEEVVVAVNKNELKYKRAPGNGQLKGYKITDYESSGFFYIIDYIRYHGFDVVNDGANISIFGRFVTTINGQRTMPMVYMDNVMVMDFNMLMNVQTSDVDEIYINRNAVVPSVDNKMGIIKMYMKKGFSRAKKGVEDTSFYVKDGFQVTEPFQNISYTSTSDKGFENFGVIDWHPVILPDANGEFTLNIPNTSQKTVKLLIEGFSVDGRMISEIKTINLK